MPVHFDSGGSGGSNFPPPGTQLANFSDNFDRPDVETLGQRWGMIWAAADSTVDATFPTPFPQRCAANPRIQDGECVWFSRPNFSPGLPEINLGRGWSIAWPQQLAWMTQGKFSQYVEADVSYTIPYTSNCILCGVFSPNAGSLYPDIFSVQNLPFQGQFGFYGLFVTSTGEDTPATFSILYSTWGAFPATIPDGIRGHAGLNTLDIEHTDPPLAPVPVLPLTARLETRWQNNRWELSAYANGTLIQTGWDTRLLGGSPGLSCSVYWNQQQVFMDPDRLMVCDNFSAGWLR